MLMSCCLCGGKLSEESPALLDPSIFGTNYFSILQQILEENEKDFMCVLDSGSLCINCVGVLEAVEICLNKLRDLKLGIMNSYKLLVSPQDRDVSQQDTEEGSSSEQCSSEEHKYPGVTARELKPRKPPEQDSDGPDYDYVQRVSDGGVLESRSDLVEVYADDEDDNDSTASLSQERDNIQVFDLVLDDPLDSSDLQVIELKLDDLAWGTIFQPNQVIDGEVRSVSLVDGWKSRLVSIFREYVEVCDIDVMSVQKPGEFPIFMGFCRFARCTRSIQLKVLEDRKLELQYSPRKCSAEASTEQEEDSVMQADRLAILENSEQLHISVGEGAKVCEYCLKQFNCDQDNEKEVIKNHLRVCHSQPRDQIFTCKCGRRFNKKNARNSHLKRCERNADLEQPLLNCEECGNLFHGVTRLQRHMKTCRPAVPCTICKKEFASSRALEKHTMSAHHEAFSTERRRYSCDKCDKVFWKKYNLESHSLMHSDLKPFICEVEGCNKRFKREVALKQHVSTRHENKTVILFCAICPAQFKSANGLKLHMETIHDMGPGRPRKLACSRCEKRFKCQADLNTHTVTHTKEKNYQCNFCELKFSRSNSLKDHLNIHRQTYRCKWCSKCFGRDRYLQNHVKICPLGPNGQKSNRESSTVKNSLLCQIVENPDEDQMCHPDGGGSRSVGDQLIMDRNQLIADRNQLISDRDQLITRDGQLIQVESGGEQTEHQLIRMESAQNEELAENAQDDDQLIQVDTESELIPPPDSSQLIQVETELIATTDSQLMATSSADEEAIESAEMLLGDPSSNTLIIKNLTKSGKEKDTEMSVESAKTPDNQIVILGPTFKSMPRKVSTSRPQDKVIKLNLAHTNTIKMNRRSETTVFGNPSKP